MEKSIRCENSTFPWMRWVTILETAFWEMMSPFHFWTICQPDKWKLCSSIESCHPTQLHFRVLSRNQIAEKFCCMPESEPVHKKMPSNLYLALWSWAPAWIFMICLSLLALGTKFPAPHKPFEFEGNSMSTIWQWLYKERMQRDRGLQIQPHAQIDSNRGQSDYFSRWRVGEPRAKNRQQRP